MSSCSRSIFAPASRTVYLRLFPLFLPFGFLFRHGSSDRGTGTAERNAAPSKRDARERRGRATRSPPEILSVIAFLSSSLGNTTLPASVPCDPVIFILDESYEAHND